MKKELLILIISNIITIISLQQALHAQSFLINGHIAGKNTGYVILTYRHIDNRRYSDTAKIHNGQFRFSGIIAGADYAALNTEKEKESARYTYSKQFFIEPEVINIDFKYGDTKNAKITGSSTQRQSEEWYNSKSSENAKLQSLLVSIDSIRTLLKNGDIEPSVAEIKIKQIDEKYRPLWQAEFVKDLAYVKKNIRSYLSLQLLKYAIGHIPDDSIDILYNKLAEKIKSSSLGYGFLEYYSQYKKNIGEEHPFDKLAYNNSAPAFKIYNSRTDSVGVNTFKGSVVLLEFWELSCIPCLQANPLIEKLRIKYSGNKFVVIAINSASASELKKLSSYIFKNNFTKWRHVSINLSPQQKNTLILNGDFKNYYSLGVPRSVLIDKRGNIIYKSMGYSSENMRELETLVIKAVSDDNN